MSERLTNKSVEVDRTASKLSVIGDVRPMLKAFTQLASMLVIFAGSLVLAARTLRAASPLRRIGVLAVEDVNTALLFILAGLALGLLSSAIKPPVGATSGLMVVERRVGVASAAVIVIIALVTMCEHLFGWNLGVEQLFFREVLFAAPGSLPDQMPFNIAFSFFCVGSALLFLTARIRLAQILTLFAGFVTLVAVMVAVYGFKPGYGLDKCAHMGLVSLLAFLLLCAGLVCAGIGHGMTDILTRVSSGGVITRRLMPPAFILPVVFGWLTLTGVRGGYFGAELGLMLCTMANVAMFSLFLLGTARTLDRVDTGRVRAEWALHEAEANYRDICENATAGIFQMSAEGRILTANPALAKILGFSSVGEMIRAVKDARGLFFAVARQYEQFLEQVQRTGSTAAPLEVEGARKDGRRVWLSMNAHAVSAADGTLRFYEGMVADITERRNLEEQFRQSQKMEAVGRLAGGVAHDFNNILTVILCCLEMAEAEFPADSAVAKRIMDIKKPAQRAASLIRQLLAFSRRQTLTLQILDLNALVKDIEKMLRRLIGEDIQMITNLSPNLATVKADPGQIEQVIMNLAVNARDAMPKGGTFTIAISNVKLEANTLGRPLELAPGDYVLLTLADTGCGMSEEVQRRLFEPFFTTKAKGKGTGLGLATVYGIVNQSGGHITVTSKPSCGATFNVYLPRVEAAAGTDKDQQPTPASPRGTETILVVEDDEDVCARVREILEGLGYTVLAAASADQALHIADSHEGPIDLLLCDVLLPDVNGPRLARQLAVSRAAMKVVFMSGHTDEVIGPSGLTSEWPFIQKPFTGDALARKIRERLDTAPPEAGVDETDPRAESSKN